MKIYAEEFISSNDLFVIEEAPAKERGFEMGLSPKDIKKIKQAWDIVRSFSLAYYFTRVEEYNGVPTEHLKRFMELADKAYAELSNALEGGEK